MPSLIWPHGGVLVEGILDEADAEGLAARSTALPSLVLDSQELLDLELLASGGASPVRGFMGRADHRSVLDRQRLASGALFPIPITLAVPDRRHDALAPGTEVALRDADGALRGAITVRETFVRDVREEAHVLYGTDDPSHRGVRYLLSRPARALGGEVALLRPRTSVFETAREVRRRLAQHGFFRVAAGMGAGVPEAANAARNHVDALLVRAPAGDETLAPPFPVVLARLPPSARHAGARDALLHALLLRNFGVTHLVLDASRADLATADALIRFRRELGLAVVHAAGRAAGAAPGTTRAAA